MTSGRNACPMQTLTLQNCLPGLSYDDCALRRLPARSTICTTGAEASAIYAIRSGWAMVYRRAGGGRRQILKIALPGDVLNLELLVGDESSYCVQSITPVVLCSHAAGAVREALSHQPAAQAALVKTLLTTLRRAANRIVDLGSRSAAEAVASMILDLHRRLTRRGLVSGSRFGWPVTQEVMADYLGISRVHVTRTLAQLRNDGLIDFESGHIVIRDVERLGALVPDR